VSDAEDRPAHADRARPEDDLLGRSLALVRFLRDGCPWDARQTPDSLRPYLLEEAHETADAVRAGDDDELAGELGDLLLNVAFQIVLAEERGAFGAGEVVRRLEAKMEARHPHVYGDADEPPDWEEMKARERTESPGDAEAADGDPRPERDGNAESGPGRAPDPVDRPRSSGDGPPTGLEPLSRALRVQQRAAAMGFAWPSAGGALAKLREEIGELEEALERRGPADAGGTVPEDELEEEVGDLLLAAVTVARHASVHPMRALERATRTFERRFRALVRRADRRGVDLDDASPAELEALWGRVKGDEGSGAAG
jgi:uncharacterized protein YabN with tetrapyrrole methylase and pyrophosphatase domain